MLSFECDYNTGAHPKILEALMRTNTEPQKGYGNDIYTEQAREKIKKACGRSDADVYFLVGGTQTNRIVIDAMLKNYEGVIAPDTGHISVHEAGAVEASGHKVLTVEGHDGKLRAADAEKLISSFYTDGAHEHMVFPGMVYISHPSEYGLIIRFTFSRILYSISHITIEKKGYAIRIPLKITFLIQVCQSKYDKLRYRSS